MATTASYFRAKGTMSGSLAMSPSMENTPSVKISLRRARFAAFSLSSRSAMSECRYTAVWHFVMVFARRIESMMDAWLSWSEITMSCSPSRVGTSPSFAFQQLTYVSDDSHPTNRSEEHTSELQSLAYLVCRLLLEKKKRRNLSQPS